MRFMAPIVARSSPEDVDEDQCHDQRNDRERDDELVSAHGISISWVAIFSSWPRSHEHESHP